MLSQSSDLILNSNYFEAQLLHLFFDYNEQMGGIGAASLLAMDEAIEARASLG